MASTLRRRRKTPAYLATEGRKHASKQRSTNFAHGEVHMTQKAELELPEEMVGEPYLEESSPFPSVRSTTNPIRSSQKMPQFLGLLMTWQQCLSARVERFEGRKPAPS